MFQLVFEISILHLNGVTLTGGNSRSRLILLKNYQKLQGNEIL